ncbi:MAG: molybdenum cofactor biosynthesis protein [Deltaproteobacteria bacterium RIFCSPLOWO2_12_FULL_43_16]|nr:MAG: molybdenum cofactor biosynthesis protein [Deltaproteobacteria bacterium GWA2_43_19]OGQ10078.1 MAG: molybdenum cofactor biosynthesis protein [Deltaproteobacteria bacterium RIFCSPHIGHO2_02_FULL_43_33]OGQ40159.1 MAG: molybdenum cofactor biosynthesis protein [Deltaproteobacteria bacterium RIFCSPLOWO2_01_FULL_42_9]OGQ59061.1 MAG: molybdenum cofactor biosynthesis protein [Deltaproteobacteria bacterium RIFCSPLOWO2_12_FULL_43_16]HBR18451.1 molybdopterin adenylyltransferase [Deltaproteobacteria 
MITVGILTMSDKGSRGEREDLSGKEIERMIKDLPAEVMAYEVIPDETDIIKAKIKEFVDKKKLDLILTTGGTGVSPRDVTPEATRAVIEKELPGMAEVMRAESLKKTPNAMISRAVCGIRKQSLIINLPGSPRAVRENLSVVLPAISHAVEKIKGSQEECGKA